MKNIAIGGLAALTLSALAAGPLAAQERDFIAQLMPVKGILPADSPARGTATFQLSTDGARIEYEVTAFGLEGVTQIHIHVGEDATTMDGKHYHLSPDEKAGPVAVFLLHHIPGGITAKGRLAKGAFTAADLRGPFKGQPMATFVDHIDQGATYVNIHISEHIGKGCCPSGLRGIIEAVVGRPGAVANPETMHTLAPAAAPRHPS